MKKLLKTVLVTGIVLATVSNVFAYERESFNTSYSRGNMMSNMSEDEYNEMKEYMEDNFGSSMMDDYSYEDMVKRMGRGFGRGRGNMMSNMTEDEYNEMKEYMKDNFGSSMMNDYSYDEMVESMDRGFGNGRGFGRGRGCFGSNSFRNR